MVAYFWSLIVLVMLLPQGNQPPDFGDLLTPAERAQLARQTKIDGRIKVYQAASERFKAAVLAIMTKHDFSSLQSTLDSWGRFLELTARDIDASITNRKKKSGALIRYEIHLRRSITQLQPFKTELPVEEIDQLDAWLTRAEAVHQLLVDVLFPK